MVNLGSLYETCNGVEQDFALAKEWHQKAADAGEEAGKKMLESLISRGY